MGCEHKFVHLETVKLRPSRGPLSRQWKRIDRFFCEKCLEEREKVKTAEHWEEQPDWW